jgi:hypothetical protein
MMPVGAAMMEYPSIMMNEARILPNVDTGVMSPYPTVVRVTIDQYSFGNRREALVVMIFYQIHQSPNKKPESIQRIKR